MKSYSFAVKNSQICNRRSKPTYYGEAHFKHYSIKCRSPMINIVWSAFNPISTKTTRPPKSVIIFYTKFDFFSIFQPASKLSMISIQIYFSIKRRGCSINRMRCRLITWLCLVIR